MRRLSTSLLVGFAWPPDFVYLETTVKKWTGFVGWRGDMAHLIQWNEIELIAEFGTMCQIFTRLVLIFRGVSLIFMQQALAIHIA